MKLIEMKITQSSFLWLLLFVTLLVNFAALAAIPRFASFANTKQSLPFYALAALWSGFLLIRYQTGKWRWLAYVAGVPGLLWAMSALGALCLLLSR
jgi:hypothetical protein